MKFTYAFKTKDNVRHTDVIEAPSKDDAYSILKSRGIRPIRVDEAPGFWNKALGRGKRWAAIVVLAVLTVILTVVLWRGWIADVEREAESIYAERSQLYGDPVVIQEATETDWALTFADIGDRWLSQHAIPGKPCNCKNLSKEMRIRIAAMLVEGRTRRIAIEKSDLTEIAKMKRMVNGMKRELDEYLVAGGDIDAYMRRVDIRQRAEIGIYDRIKREMSKSNDMRVWRQKNAELRAMGLPLVATEDHP